MARSVELLRSHPPALLQTNGFRQSRLVKELPESEAMKLLVRRVDPLYSRMALWRGIEGDVHLNITTDEHGNVASAVVITGEPLLRTPALEAVYQWRFTPVLQKDPHDFIDAPEKPASLNTDIVLHFVLPRSGIAEKK